MPPSNVSVRGTSGEPSRRPVTYQGFTRVRRTTESATVVLTQPRRQTWDHSGRQKRRDQRPRPIARAGLSRNTTAPSAVPVHART